MRLQTLSQIGIKKKDTEWSGRGTIRKHRMKAAKYSLGENIKKKKHTHVQYFNE